MRRTPAMTATVASRAEPLPSPRTAPTPPTSCSDTTPGCSRTGQLVLHVLHGLGRAMAARHPVARASPSPGRHAGMAAARADRGMPAGSQDETLRSSPPVRRAVEPEEIDQAAAWSSTTSASERASRPGCATVEAAPVARTPSISSCNCSAARPGDGWPRSASSFSSSARTR